MTNPITTTSGARRKRHHLLWMVVIGLAVLLTGTPAQAQVDLTFVFQPPSEFADQPLPETTTLRRWIEAMKQAPRGPFKRIRWFCADGRIYPPKPNACSERGGGVQHGEWSDQVKLLRGHGYLLANVLADVQPEPFFAADNWPEHLKQMVLEQFLIAADDGWIMRQARFYRGALQVEDEIRHGRALLNQLLQRDNRSGSQFLLLRETVRLLPHGRQHPSLSRMRQLARSLAEQDPGFEPLRTKLHVQPEPSDVQRIRRYGTEQGLPALQPAYLQLAELMAQLYRSKPIEQRLEEAAGQLPAGSWAQQLHQQAEELSLMIAPEQRYHRLCGLLAQVRDHYPTLDSPEDKLAMLHLSLDLEQACFNLANVWLDQLPSATRRQGLAWLRCGVDALYGSGLLSHREYQSQQQSEPPAGSTLTAADYHDQLSRRERVSHWAAARLHKLFDHQLQRWTPLEPLVQQFIPDRLRGSLLTPYAQVLAQLSGDAKRQLGIRSELFGHAVTSGVQALNPGLARGTLRRWQPDLPLSQLEADGIYLLPDTVAELPRVAGIITTAGGNALSHVQLLARNLAIPNIALDQHQIERITPYLGQQVVLVSSPAGVVRLKQDNAIWQALFQHHLQPPDEPIEPDLNRLDLSRSRPIALSALRADDSGRSVGPKAANLGELKAHFPDLVADGVVLPFGLFHQFLQQPVYADGPAMFDWLTTQYRQLAQLPADQRLEPTHNLLRQLRHWITHQSLAPEVREQLRQMLQQQLGADGSYGVFVRSDTNVEDLPGFSGAGLNLTLPHVVGFDAIVDAILQVWASPFTERAYSWRQAHMPHPEQLYVSVLLMKSVPADRSGVLVTQDIFQQRPHRFTIAVNEGIGGAVAGQRAEELLVDSLSGQVTLLNQASEASRRQLNPSGGIDRVAAGDNDRLLSDSQIQQLIELGRSAPHHFPLLRDGHGQVQAADIEFGFVGDQPVLFQLRPFVESRWARNSRYLAQLDAPLLHRSQRPVDLTQEIGGTP